MTMKLLFLLLLTTSAYADMSECSKTTIQDDKNYCMAKYAGSATFCDKIKGYERRTQCMRMVITKQRELAYSIMPKKEEKKE
jgi:hypothetical protein